MDDMKDKFKGFMKKMTPSSSSGKFKGQGRVLGSSSGPTNSDLIRPYSQFLNSNNNNNGLNVTSYSQSNSKLTQNNNNNNNNNNNSTSVSKPTSSIGGPQKGSSVIPKPNLDHDSNRDRVPKDGFDPFDSLITTGNRNKNGYSLTNVFECPVCGSGFTSEEDVSLHIESCIEKNDSIGGGNDGGGGGGGGGGSSGGDLDFGSVGVGGSEGKTESMDKLEACIGVYFSGNPSENSIDVILRLLRNIVKEPENPKFRKIRMSNPKIREAIGEVTGGVELLEIVGFELKEEEGEMWEVMDTPSETRVSMLKNAVDLLEQTKNGESLVKGIEKVELEKVKESEPKIVDRQIKVFFSVPENVAARIELPDSFYNRSAEEVRREAELRRKKLAESQLLIPKSLKEKQAQAARKRYNRAMIRVQFPDGVVLQGVFSPKEPTSALYEFVSSALKQDGLEFELIHPIPVKRRVIPCFPSVGEKTSTLEDENLVPSALVKFKPLETDSMVFTGLRNELLEISEPLGSGSS